ncbi:hypothetical protein BJP37_13725 [Moorena bouillonii PNG]|uniref:Uncharacterized protein n=1 Tax=Moorena bouillonii PNG TaxID=568701 RepID=A0A1U7N1U9_9CYAN|nr:hypothetical protein BJP37_13725 [Moorena bouillonii PNG]
MYLRHIFYVAYLWLDSIYLVEKSIVYNYIVAHLVQTVNKKFKKKAVLEGRGFKPNFFGKISSVFGSKTIITIVKYQVLLN